MDNITIGQITATVACIVAFITGVKYLLDNMKKLLEASLKPTNDKIDKVEKKLSNEIEKIDLNATKSFLISKLQDIKSDNEIDDITKQRFYEQYEHYKNLGGNSYISSEIDRLRKEGKL